MTAYATLYLANDARLPLEFLQRMVPFAQVAALPPGPGTAGGYGLSTPSWTLRLDAMPAEQMASHLESFKVWLSRVAPPDERRAELEGRLAETKLVLGCAAEPGFDPGGYMRRLLAAIARPGRGLVFAFDGVYGADGALVVGAQGVADRFLPSDLSPLQRWALATTAIVTRYFNESHEMLGGTVVNSGTILRAKKILGDPWDIGDRKDLLEMLKYLARPEAEQEFLQLVGLLAAGKPVPDDDYDADQVAFARACAGSLGPRGLLAHDLCRLVYVAGKGFVAGFVSEAEAWGWCLAAAHRLQLAYGSWQELGQHYLLGVTFRRGADEDLERCYKELLADPGSPWRTLPWAVPLA